MGGGDTELTGPDLTLGVPDADLTEGTMLLGHAHGEPVLLSRVDGDVHAVGAKCTHYGGPLAEGLAVDGTVRCPWHHACFDLRTGEAVRPPALSHLARWRVTVDGGRITVGERMEPATPERTPRQAPASVLIVGAGAAGDSAALTLRKEGYEGDITLIDPDGAAPCDRPNLSKDYLAGNAPEEWISLHPPTFFAEQQIERIQDDVTAIDPTHRTITLASTGKRTWGALILATGAEPVKLPLVLGAGARVLYLRSLADSRAIIKEAEKGGRAVVIGASFIGLEVAASLRNRGVEVHVVAPESIPLARVMGEDLGRYVRDIHEEKGVRFHLGHTVASIESDHVKLDDGTRLDADFVVVGIGVRPRVELAQDAGLSVNNGIVVDEFLESSHVDIFAAGDVATWPDSRIGRHIRVEHWVVAQRMGQTAARNVLGARERFEIAPFFWSQHYDATIAYVGHAPEWDQAELDGNPADMDCAVTFRHEGKRLAVASIFRDDVSLRAELEMEREAAAGSPD